MSRLRFFTQGVVSGYGTIAANLCYSFAAIPLALHYLGKEEFGLWALILQLIGYLTLIDSGMSASLTRLLIDHKDERGSTDYGEMVTTAWAVFSAQGAIVIGCGVLFSGMLASLAVVPAEFQRQFVFLLSVQCLIVGISFSFRIFSQLLLAHHRLALVNISQIANFAVALVTLWLCLRSGKGIMSLVYANATGMGCGSGLLAAATLRYRLLPQRGSWGGISWQKFSELFRYARDVFLINIGQQFIFASQTIIVSRALGLEAAATWAVCIRPFTILYQLCWRPLDMSFTIFSEMIVRNELDRLRNRYSLLVRFTLFLAAFGVIGFTMCNQPFIAVWTQGAIGWPVLNDALLGVWFLFLTISRCSSWLIQASKQIRHLKYFYILEGVFFVLAGSLAAEIAGLAGVITTSIICTVLFTASYGAMRAAQYLEVAPRILWVTSARPVLLYIASIAAPATVVYWWTAEMPPGGRLAVNFGFSVVASVLLMRHILPTELRNNILDMIPHRANPLLAFLLGKA